MRSKASLTGYSMLKCDHFIRPFWLSPRQAIVVPVAAPHKAYASEVQKKLWDAGIYSEVDLSDATLPKKIVRPVFLPSQVTS